MFSSISGEDLNAPGVYADRARSSGRLKRYIYWKALGVAGAGQDVVDPAAREDRSGAARLMLEWGGLPVGSRGCARSKAAFIASAVRRKNGSGCCFWGLARIVNPLTFS